MVRATIALNGQDSDTPIESDGVRTAGFDLDLNHNCP